MNVEEKLIRRCPGWEPEKKPGGLIASTGSSPVPLTNLAAARLRGMWNNTGGKGKQIFDCNLFLSTF